MTEWRFDPEVNPHDFHGFIYKITNKVTCQAYIGRKYLWVEKKNKIVKESDWKKYWGSCPDLLDDIKKYGIEQFDREILQWCHSRGETNFAEVEHQFRNDVLKATLPDGTPAFYNRNIMSKFFARTIETYADPAFQARQRAVIQKALEKAVKPSVKPAQRARRPDTSFTPEQVRAIRAASAAGMKGFRLAERYGVSRASISNIINRKTYANVD